MTQSLVVNFLAGAGAGKSTFTAGVFEKLKWAGIKAEIASEFAKDLVWENRDETFKDQLYILGKQYHRIFRLNGKVEVILTDSPIILSSIYAPVDYPESFNTLVLDMFNTFNNVNYFIRRKKPYVQEGRLQDESGAREIDKQVIGFLIEKNMPFFGVDGIQDNVQLVADSIITHLEELKSE